MRLLCPWDSTGKNPEVGCHFLLQETLGKAMHISMGSENMYRDFPGGPVFKNLPYNAGDMGSIPGQGTGESHMPWSN